MLDERGTINPQQNLDNIVSYQVVSAKDTVKNLNSGMLSSKLITHDVYNKRLDLYKYNYIENFDTDIHPDNGSLNLLFQSAKDPDSHKNLTEYDDTRLFVSSTASGYSFSENGNYPYQSDNLNQTLQRKLARKEQFENGMILNVEINGQTFIQAGDKVSLEIGNTSSITPEKEDVNLSGNYLVTHLRHSFSKSKELKHQIIMQVAKTQKRNICNGNHTRNKRF